MAELLSVTAIAPVNLATVKYWGKRDEDLILPLNDSISVTLSSKYMYAKTTLAISPLFEKDQIWLNGIEESIENPRLQNCFRKIKESARISSDKLNWRVRICSENNFPTAAGLASSSAGYACLVFALSKIYDVPGNVSSIARHGSGSACRSMFGGFVHWQAGVESDGSDSLAIQLAPVSHWPEMRVLILVVNDQKKKTGSTVGMKRTAETSELFQHRIQNSVKKHIAQMKQAIKDKNFDLFAEITMKESNQLHAVCLDTYPPAIYMNDTSHAISAFVHEYNNIAKGQKVAYTFDAGPNAVLFLMENEVPSLLSAILKTFPFTGSHQDYLKGIPINISPQSETVAIDLKMEPDLLKYIIYTEVGDGPSIISDGESLLNENGLPKCLS